MTDLSRGARVRRGGRRPGWVLLTALLVLAIGASSALVFTNRVELLKLAVILALWAAVVAAFVSVIYRRQSDVDQARARDLKLVYDLQLDREISARREYELTVESQLRRELASELRAHSADEVSALRAELAALRTNLEILFDAELSERPALETERRTVRGYSDWDREHESARERVNRVTSVRAEEPRRMDDSSIIDVPEEPLVPPPRQPVADSYQPAAYAYQPAGAHEGSRANRAAEPYEVAEADRGTHGARGDRALEPSRTPRRRRRVGPRRGHHRRAGPSGSLRAVAGRSRKRRRPMVGLRRRGHHPRAREGGTSPNPHAVPTGGTRRRRSPSRGLYLHRRRPGRRPSSSGPSGRRLPRRAAVKKRRWVGSRSAPKDNGCPPEHLAATGSPNRPTTPAPGPGMTPRHATHASLGSPSVSEPTSAPPPPVERRGRHSSVAEPADQVGESDAGWREPEQRARSRHSAENSAYPDSDIGGPATPAPAMSPPPPPMPPSPPSPTDREPAMSPPPSAPPPAARHRSTDPLDTDAPPSGGQSVAELLARLQTSSSGGGRRRRRED